MSKTAALLTVIGLSTIVGAAGREADGCLDGRQSALIAGGFSGPLICSAEDATFEPVGNIGSGRYAIYDYRYRFRAAAVTHGGQRIVIFKGRDYVGQYVLSPPPFADLAVNGADVIVTGGANPGRWVLDFSEGPPHQAFIDGYALNLDR